MHDNWFHIRIYYRLFKKILEISEDSSIRYLLTLWDENRPQVSGRKTEVTGWPYDADSFYGSPNKQESAALNRGPRLMHSLCASYYWSSIMWSYISLGFASTWPSA